MLVRHRPTPTRRPRTRTRGETSARVYRDGAWVTPGGPVVDGPYRAEIIDEDGAAWPLYSWEGQNYLLGQTGSRYRIHVTNRSARRVEAVVSVDGLEVIGGRPADLKQSRGYIVPAFGDVTIDGFRTSMDDVAAFRFSSVRDSYAGRKGNDRNVGVIGIAFFPERERMVVRTPPPRPMAQPPEKRRAYPSDEAGSADSASGATPAPASPSGAAAPRAAESSRGGARRWEEPEAKADRPGLGTEFGERHDSSARYTTFERRDSSSPAVVIEIHYNDREGLRALGIPVDPPYVSSDENLRRSANPFPANRFATPPPGDNR